MHPHHLDDGRGVLGADLLVCAVGGPPGRLQEAAQWVGRRLDPPGGAAEPVGAQGVGDGVQEPRPVALALGLRVDHELGDERVFARVGVGVVGRADGREADDAVVADPHQHPQLGQRRTGDGRVPRLGHGVEVDVGQDVPGDVRGEELLPAPPLNRGQRFGLGRKREPAGVGDARSSVHKH